MLDEDPVPLVNASTVTPKVEKPPEGVEPIKETAAARSAYILIGSFFGIAALPLIAIFAASGGDMAKAVTNAVEWIKGVSAYLAGLVGAVVGYYYRSTTEKVTPKTK